MSRRPNSPLFVIFTTVLVDLVGFGMVIPLVGLYGRHTGATGFRLAILGAIFSVCQFVFTPFWGSLSDRIGRRPVILISLLGSTISYLIFGLSQDFAWLLGSRAFGGIFAANISAAQAYMADITSSRDRAKGMGLIGAAFGIGFTLGPPIGGIAAAKLGLAAPGLIAAAICGLNFLVAIFRLPESLAPHLRKQAKKRSWVPLQMGALQEARSHGDLLFLLASSFFVTFSFSNMEQTLSLLFQWKFSLETGEAGYRTGMILMVAGLLGALIQGGMIRRLVAHFGERRLMLVGLASNLIAMLIFPYGPSYASYFLIVIPLAVGSSLINPTLAALISRSVGSSEQGSVLGVSQSLASLARACGPIFGLTFFAVLPAIPYWAASGISAILLLSLTALWKGRLNAV